MSFVENIRALTAEAEAAAKENAEKREDEHRARMEEVKDEKFKFLTEKYLATILRSIKNSARQGKRARYINFDRNDFKANCKGLGYPGEFQRAWLTELSNPESKYLLDDKENLEGISFDIWNNGAFTTVFTW